MIIQSGNPWPLGASVQNGGINFSLFSPYATQVELLLFQHEKDTEPSSIHLDININKTYYYWHIFIEGLQAGTLYAYRVNGVSSTRNKFDPTKVLLDPYGKAIVGEYSRALAKEEGVNNLTQCLKNYVVDHSHYNWEGVESPQFSNSKNIIYELHPKGFTKALGTPNSGTFSALSDQIPYLKALGVNTVELMPIFYFDEQDAPKGHTNYWGYSPLSFFALHNGYCHAQEAELAIQEFKDCIKKFHKNNIKVVLDVVYNHTAESDFSGPCYSFKGIANSTYYYINEQGEYLDFTGCGNTLNTNHSVVRRMIIDSLLYWKKEFHIDGFRFDLAGVMTRDEKGNHIDVPPIIWEIDSDPHLADAILIAEPWDVKGYHTTNFPGDKWSVWQDKFRDVMRKTVKGDLGMINDFISYFTSSYHQEKSEYLYYKPQRNINFITCHDGFTLHDLVSYNEKHNWENGEDNKDGSNHNLSYNYGIEGDTQNQEIVEIRIQQIKNFFCCLLLSHGTPMLSMGDEVCRTQWGNNNPYSLDIPKNWFDWQLVQQHTQMFQFVQKLISLRKNYKLFSYKDYFSSEKNEQTPYYQLHGIQQYQPDLSYHSRSIGIQYISPKFKENLLLIFNFYAESLVFELPKGKWNIEVSTDLAASKLSEGTLQVSAHSIVILNKI